MTSPLMRAARNARPASIDELSDGGDVIVLAPHPDDESLGCGGAIAAITAAGRRAQVIVVTDGGRSHPVSRSHPPDRLCKLRAGEVKRAVDILTQCRGPVPILLGYPDTDAPDGTGVDEAIGRIVPYITPATRAVWCSWGGDPHVDHARCARLASRLAAQQRRLALWSYPIWGRFDDTATGFVPDALAQFDTRVWQSRKAAAIAAHRSQMAGVIRDDPSGFRMTDAHQGHFTNSPEIFMKEIVVKAWAS